MLVHPLYEHLLDRFCVESGLDAPALREMMTGLRPIPPETMDMLSAALDVPRGAWPKVQSAPLRLSPLVSRGVSRHNAGDVTPEQRAAVLRDNARRRRRYSSRVHEVLDALDWTVADLAERVSQELGRNISRPLMQFYATGTRQVGPRGASRSHKVVTPLDVREAAEVATRRAAKEQNKGAAGVLLANAWPVIVKQ